jgi:FkbM family methyltransferase
MQDGSFEPIETGRVTKLLQQTDLFVNVGANVGYYVCLARQLGKRVIAVEPLEQNVQLLQRNVLANEWNDVEILPVGLGDRTSLLRLYGGGTAASFVPGWAGAQSGYFQIVPVTTLDAILSGRFDGERILILIDVEGFELQVLKGALQQICRTPAPTWLIEICINEHQPDGVRVNPNLQPTFQIFWDHGYSAETVEELPKSVSEKDVAEWVKGSNLPVSHNFLFRRQADHLPLSLS